MQRFTRPILWLLFAPAALVLLSAAFVATYWTVPAGSTARFAIDGMLGVDAKGGLRFDSSAIRFDPAQPEDGSMAVTLDAASINTGIGKRDKHLRSADFLEVEKYPKIRFVSTAIAKTAAGYDVRGNLTIKAVTKPVTIPFTFSQEEMRGVFRGSFRINRLDFGVGEGYKKSIGKEVRIQLEVPVTEAKS